MEQLAYAPYKFTYAEFLQARSEWRGLWKSLTYRKDLKIPDEWRDYKAGRDAFTRAVLGHAGPRPNGDYDLARIDPSKAYAPENIEWLPATAAATKANVKLTNEEVAEIRARRLTGESPTAIAALYKVSPGHIVNICMGRTRPVPFKPTEE